MSYMDLLTFVLGDITEAPLAQAVGTLVVMLLIKGLLEIGQAKDKKAAAISWLKRAVAYLVFLIVAHRVDELAVDRLFGWTGSTQYLVTLGLGVREGKPLLVRVGQWAGVVPPETLTSRLNQMEQGRVSDSYIDGRDLDLKILNLRENLGKLQEYNRLKQEANGLIYHNPTPQTWPAENSEPTV